MQRVKARIFSGVVCEQIVFNIGDKTNIKTARPAQPRFRDEAEREKHRVGILRRNHARLVNANFTPASLYSTLTIDNEHEVHTFEEARRLRNNFVRRLQHACPDAKIIIYMGRGKGTDRIHMHMLSDGVPAEVITAKWGLGSVTRIMNLKKHCYYDGKDHGQDYTGLANYLFDHWTPEQGGHHFKATRNLAKPEHEKPAPAKIEYSQKRAPRCPKGYELVEASGTSYGYYYFKYVKIPEKGRRTRTPKT